MNKLFNKIAAGVVGLAMAVGVGVAIGGQKTPLRTNASEEKAYTLDGTIAGTGSSYAGDNTATQSSVDWTINGNVTMNPWRIGGKSITNTTRLVRSDDPVSAENISKVNLTVGTASNVTVNSLKLLVGTAAGGSQTSTVTGTFAVNSTITFERPSGADWSSKYFTFEFNITISDSSNKYIQFKKAEFYYEASAPATYQVTYDGNGATSGSVPTDETVYSGGDTVTVKDNTGNLAITDYSFTGWNTAANGSGTPYTASQTFTISENTTLYAQWRYMVRYVDDTTAKTITWDLSMPTYEDASDSQVNWTSPKATMLVEKNEASTATNNYLPPAQSSTRFYKSSRITISPVAGYKIISIVAQATTENYANKFVDSTWTNATVVADATTFEVTITPTSNISSVIAVIGDTCGFSSFVVNYASAAALSSIAISSNMTKTDYNLNDNWDPTGLVVTATYADSSTLDVTSSVIWEYSPATANSVSINSVTITAKYTENSVEKTATKTQSVTVTKNVTPTTDSIVVGDTTPTNQTYALTTGITKNTAVYSSYNAKATAANGAGLQYRSSDSQSGLVSTSSGGLIKTIAITYSSGKTGGIEVYGSDTAYSSPADLYSTSTQGRLLGIITEASTTLNIDDDFQYIGIKSSGGSRYLDSISLSWVVYDSGDPFIRINQDGTEQEVGGSGTFTATVRNSSASVVWSSSDTSVISVDASTGSWTANKQGMAVISATLGSTGKKSNIIMYVTGLVNVAEARSIIDGLDGKDSPYRVTVTGYVIEAVANAQGKANYITIADVAGGSPVVKIFFNYVTLDNWSDISVVGARIKAKGTLCLYNTDYELKDIISVEVVDADRAAVEDFVLAYMHMNDYTSNQGYCNDSSHHYYLTAKQGLNDLTPAQLTLFREDAEFTSAKARYEAWAVANNDGAPFDGNDEIVTTINNRIAIFGKIDDEQSGTAIAITVASILSVAALGGYFFLKKKKITK